MITAQEQAVLEEYLRRRVLRQTGKSFLDFVRYTTPWLVFEEFHILISEHFQQLLEGIITRLMIFAPPRAGKSLFTSELLPQWWIGNLPNDQILHTSYATTLVEGFGRKTRNVIAGSEEFQELYPTCRISSDSKSAARWNTTEGGVYHAAGVGTGIAGKGWHLGLCLNPSTKVSTPSGITLASDIKQGDILIGGRVIKKSLTTHEFEYTVNRRLRVSGEHPIWTHNRGWVEAKNLLPGDRLKTLTVWRRLWERLNFYLRPLLTKRGAV